MDPFMLRVDHSRRVRILKYYLHVQLSASRISHPRIGPGARGCVTRVWHRRPKLSLNGRFDYLWMNDWSAFAHEPRVGILKIRVLCDLCFESLS
jgi:hypothetical protein